MLLERWLRGEPWGYWRANAVTPRWQVVRTVARRRAAGGPKKSRARNKHICWATWNAHFYALRARKRGQAVFQDDGGGPGAPLAWHTTKLDGNAGSQGTPNKLCQPPRGCFFSSPGFGWGSSMCATSLLLATRVPSSHPSNRPSLSWRGSARTVLEAFGPFPLGLLAGMQNFGLLLHPSSVTKGHSCSFIRPLYPPPPFRERYLFNFKWGKALLRCTFLGLHGGEELTSLSMWACANGAPRAESQRVQIALAKSSGAFCGFIPDWEFPPPTAALSPGNAFLTVWKVS